jgi:hypothetical protein
MGSGECGIKVKVKPAKNRKKGGMYWGDHLVRPYRCHPMFLIFSTMQHDRSGGPISSQFWYEGRLPPTVRAIGSVTVYIRAPARQGESATVANTQFFPWIMRKLFAVFNPYSLSTN